MVKIKAFVSYNSEDNNYARVIREKLIKLDIDVFLSRQDMDIPPSENWETTVISELLNADIFVVVLSENFRIIRLLFTMNRIC